MYRCIDIYIIDYMYIHTFTDTPGGSTCVSHASPSRRVRRRRRDAGYSGYSGCGLRRGWHLAAALQEPEQWLFKKRLRGAERKVRESVSPVSMDEYTRWLYDWPTRSAGAADAAKQVDRVGCCSPCCHAQRLAKGSAYSFVPRILEAEDKLEMLRRRHWEPAECPRARGACFISEALAMGALP